MCSSQNKRIISSEKYSTKSIIVTPTLANCWCGIMIKFRALLRWGGAGWGQTSAVRLN